MMKRFALLLLIISITILFACSQKDERPDSDMNLKYGEITPALTELPDFIYKDNLAVTSENINPGDYVFEHSSFSPFFAQDKEFHGYVYSDDCADWFSEIEKTFGVKLKIIDLADLYYSSPVFGYTFHRHIDEFIKEKIIDGTIRGLFKVGTGDYVKSLANAGLIIPLDNYLINNANWRSLPEGYKNAYKINGVTYAVPSGRNTRVYTRYFRKDWLDILKIEEPGTINAFYETMKMFTYQDPDGDGEDNTCGFSHVSYMGLEDIFSAFDVRLNPYGELLPTWNPNTDRWEDSMLKPQMEEFFIFVRQCIDQGLLEYDSSEIQENLFEQGIAGSHNTFLTLKDISDTVNAYGPGLQFPEISYISALSHIISDNQNGYFTQYFIPMVMTKTSKFPDTTMNILIDVFMADETGHIMGRYGAEGSGYFMDGDTVVFTTIEVDGRRIAYQGPKITMANPYSTKSKISDYRYDNGQMDINIEFFDYYFKRIENIKMDGFCYEIPWNYANPEYPDTMLANLDEIYRTTELLYRKILSGAVSYHEALDEYKEMAKRFGLQEFLDRQNMLIGAKTTQSYD